MDFKVPYVEWLANNDPKAFNQICRSGMLQAHLQQKSVEAHRLLRELLANEPKDSTGLVKNPAAEINAENQVFALMCEGSSQAGPEPPHDLPQTRR